jgi:hypothetical protein
MPCVFQIVHGCEALICLGKTPKREFPLLKLMEKMQRGDNSNQIVGPTIGTIDDWTVRRDKVAATLYRNSAEHSSRDSPGMPFVVMFSLGKS